MIDPERLQILSQDPDIGPNLLISKDGHDLFILGHFEYDTETLDKEYQRDQAKGLETKAPVHYYVQDDPQQGICNRWRAHAHLLYHNWLNDVYQITPFALNEIPQMQKMRIKKGDSV